MATDKRKTTHSTRPDADALSVSDVRFCQHYARHGNAAEAYRQAGYRNSDSTPAAVWHAAHDTLRKAKVRTYVRQLRQEACDAAQITVDRLAGRLAAAAFADRTAVFAADGSVRPPHEWPAELRAIVAGVEAVPTDAGVRYKVRFERSTDALRVLAQWRGMIGADAAVKDLADSLKVLSGVDESKMGPPS